jgi:NAD(P)-dependent dehydrogenase (short-subunit alcohol dehydrogenase family)
MRDFNGKVAVVTGGAGGIGFAIAERFGREGCLIMLADIEKDALTAAVESLRSQGVTAVGHRCDVANHKSVEELERRTIDEFGKVHLLFNNAGVSITGPSWLLSYDDWRWVWDVNVWGVINGVKTFLPGMLAHGEGGHVINTGSLASFFGNGDHAPYSSSKAAVLGMSQSLYSEMKAMMTGIGVSIVCPGMVATKIHQSYRNRPEGDQPWSDREFANPPFRQRTSLNRLSRPSVTTSSTSSTGSEFRFSSTPFLVVLFELRTPSSRPGAKTSGQWRNENCSPT